MAVISGKKRDQELPGATDVSTCAEQKITFRWLVYSISVSRSEAPGHVHQETIISLKGNVKVSKGVKTVSGPVLTQLDLLMQSFVIHLTALNFSFFYLLYFRLLFRPCIAVASFQLDW